MHTFRKWASIADKLIIRTVLFFLGLLVTVSFGGAALLGVQVTLLEGEATSVSSGWYWWIVTQSISGLIAILAAWVRILISSKVLQGSRLLRFVITTCLGVGVLVSLFLTGLSISSSSIIDPFLWVYMTMTFLGIFLMGATIGEGERSNNRLQSDAAKPRT